MCTIDSAWFGSGGEITWRGFYVLTARLKELGYEVRWRLDLKGKLAGLDVKPKPTDQHWEMLMRELCQDDDLVREVIG